MTQDQIDQIASLKKSIIDETKRALLSKITSLNPEYGLVDYVLVNPSEKSYHWDVAALSRFLGIK